MREQRLSPEEVVSVENLAAAVRQLQQSVATLPRAADTFTLDDVPVLRRLSPEMRKLFDTVFRDSAPNVGAGLTALGAPGPPDAAAAHAAISDLIARAKSTLPGVTVDADLRWTLKLASRVDVMTGVPTPSVRVQYVTQPGNAPDADVFAKVLRRALGDQAVNVEIRAYDFMGHAEWISKAAL